VTPIDTLRIAGRALRRNKLRSFLTALGIVIGVGAVIAMVAIGEGARKTVEDTFAAMGSNMLIVMSGSTNQGGARGGFGSQPTITWEDLKAIQSELPIVKYASPVLRGNSQVFSEEQNWTTSVYGVSLDYFAIRSWGVSAGAPMARADIDSAVKSAWVGQTVVDNLFSPDVDPIGKTIRIRNIPFVIAGVMDRKGQSSFGQDYDDCIMVPVSTYRARIQGGLQNYLAGTIFVGTATSDGTSRAERDIRALLRDRHRLPDGTEDDFNVRNLTEMANATEEGTRTLTALLASVAAVSLLIGGIGIMNIMLVSVTERTREIGIRMAVGARPSDILLQFLVEALSLSTVGGLIGIALGLLAAERLATQFGWPMIVNPAIIVIAVGFAAFVGIAFGLYPARKASRLDPIDALRYE
jgi:putative ABC transport system permease protein